VSRPADFEYSGGGLRLLAAFAAIYLIWGSTYLAIRFAVETLPPFLMAGARFSVAGLMMYGWARLRGAERPARAHWVTAAVIGTLMFVFGVGGVSWAEQYMPSGAAALLIAVGPLWIVLVDWLYFGGGRPGSRIMLGLLLGFCGVAVLVGPEELAGAGRIDALGAGVILFGTITWAFGSLQTRSAHLPDAPVLAIGMEMLAGGLILLAVGTVASEWGRLAASDVSLRSLLSVAYLIVFGSIIALSAYLWLLKVVSPARVVTHAFVNPIVAVLLGWTLAAEPLNRRTLIATAVIVTAVLFILTRRETRRPPVIEIEHG
jgi:drug/metabolite transporter (DMT)-like permease